MVSARVGGVDDHPVEQGQHAARRGERTDSTDLDRDVAAETADQALHDGPGSLQAIAALAHITASRIFARAVDLSTDPGVF